MEQVSSFGETELHLSDAASKINGMPEFFEASTKPMKLALVSGTSEYGIAEDLDCIIRGTLVGPVFTLRKCGWSDEEILSVPHYELLLAANVKYEYSEFKKLITTLEITEDTPELQALKMLQGKADIFECELAAEYPQYKSYLEVLSAPDDIRFVKQLLELAYVTDPPKWYLHMMAGVTSDILKRVQKHNGNFTVVLALLPLLERGICRLPAALQYSTFSSIFWVHLVTKEYNYSFPIYRWDLMWQFWDKLDDTKLHLSCSDTDLYLYDEYAGRYDYGIVTIDSEDPVQSFVDNTMAGLKLNYADSMDEQFKYSCAFYALKEMIAGRRDWYLYLRYPDIFKPFAGFNHAISLAGIIKFGIPKEQKCEVADLCTGLVQIGDKILTIYVAFASDEIQQGLDRGEMINVGCSKEKELSFNDYVTDFISWVQQSGD